VLLVEGASIDDRADRLVDDGTIVELLVETGQVLLEPATNHPAQLVVLRPDGAVQDVQIDHVGHQRKTHDGKLSTSTDIPRRLESAIRQTSVMACGAPRKRTEGTPGCRRRYTNAPGRRGHRRSRAGPGAGHGVLDALESGHRVRCELSAPAPVPHTRCSAPLIRSPPRVAAVGACAVGPGRAVRARPAVGGVTSVQQTPTDLRYGCLSRSHVDKATVVALEGHGHVRRRAITVLGHD